MEDCRELLERKERECREALREYERRWMEDWHRWNREREELQRALEEHAERILGLQKDLAAKETELSRLRSEVAELRSRLRRPSLGEGFFRRLEAHLDLLDGALLREARGWTALEVEKVLYDLGEERKAVLEGLLSGETPDWRRLWTGLLLEWALWAWLEGGDG